METRLQVWLAALARKRRLARLCRWLAAGWFVAAGIGAALLGLHVFLWIIPVGVALAAVIAAFVVARETSASWRQLFREMAPETPDARELLAAASEQESASGAFTFLQWRVIEAAVSHPRREEWQRRAGARLARAQIASAAGLIALAGVIAALAHGRVSAASGSNWLTGVDEISITPGDTNVERGTDLVIAARFGGSPPAEAALVLTAASGKQSRLRMARRLADPVFGASVPEINEALSYHIEYKGRRTRDYQVNVFEYPALVRADASLRYPAYTGLTNQTIVDTRRVSAVQGSRLSYLLQLNKPVTQARWVGGREPISFAVASNGTAILPDFVLTKSATFHLELTDAEGRANKFPIDFVLLALTNRRPVVRLDFPRGDPRVSRIEELQLQAEASDDYGLLKYGVGYGLAGQEPQFVNLGQGAPANVRKEFTYLLSLEKLKVDVDQSISYFAWADDYGPDGKERRTFSDIFFADVRPFDEVFRADSSGESQGGGQEGGGGDARVKLAETQRQIVIATWNLEKAGADLSQP